MGFFSRKKAEQPTNEHLKSSMPEQNGMIQPLTAEPLFYYNGYSSSSFTQKYNSDVLLMLYEGVSQLNYVINYIAKKANEIPYVHYKIDPDGKKIPLGETDAIKFIDSINIQDVVVQFLIHGNAFIQKKLTPGFKFPTSGIIHPSNRIYVIPANSIDQYGTPNTTIDVFENPIVRFSKQIDSGLIKNYQLDEIIHIKDVQANLRGKDYYYGSSRLFAAVDTSNTLKYLAETINTILNAKGALGFISRNSKANELDPLAMKDPVDAAEKRINEDFGTTGGRRAVMATVADLKWNRMDSPMSEFMPVELSSYEFEQICNQLGGVPAMLFNGKTNASYNNMREAKASFFTNCLSPILTHIFAEISKDLNITQKNEWIEPDFSNIEELQKDKKTEFEAAKVEDEVIRARFDNNEITFNEKLAALGLQPISNADYRKSELPQTIQPLAEKIGIGGTGAFRDILSDINLSPDQKYYSLVYLFGLDESQAKNLAYAKTMVNTKKDGTE